MLFPKFAYMKPPVSPTITIYNTICLNKAEFLVIQQSQALLSASMAVRLTLNSTQARLLPLPRNNGSIHVRCSRRTCLRPGLIHRNRTRTQQREKPPNTTGSTGRKRLLIIQRTSISSHLQETRPLRHSGGRVAAAFGRSFRLWDFKIKCCVPNVFARRPFY